MNGECVQQYENFISYHKYRLISPQMNTFLFIIKNIYISIMNGYNLKTDEINSSYFTEYMIGASTSFRHFKCLLSWMYHAFDMELESYHSVTN